MIKGTTRREEKEQPFECREHEFFCISSCEWQPKYLDEEYTDSEMAIVFGRYFISNPDLVYRAKSGIDLNQYDRSTFYTSQDPEGYVDYPFSQEWLEDHPSALA